MSYLIHWIWVIGENKLKDQVPSFSLNPFEGNQFSAQSTLKSWAQIDNTRPTFPLNSLPLQTQQQQQQQPPLDIVRFQLTVAF